MIALNLLAEFCVRQSVWAKNAEARSTAIGPLDLI